MAEEYLSLKEAQEYLGASRMKMWRLVKEGVLTTYRDSLDKRKRLVLKSDVEQLKQPRAAGINPEVK